MKVERRGVTIEKKGIIISLLLHSVFIFLLVYSSGFRNSYKSHFNAISVNIVTMPSQGKAGSPAPAKPAAVLPPKIEEKKAPEPVKKIIPQQSKQKKEEPKKTEVVKKPAADKKKEETKKTTNSDKDKESKTASNDLERIMSKIDKVSEQVEKKRLDGTGAGEGGGTPGVAGPGGGIDDIRYKLYYDRIWAKIKESWILPDIPGMDVKEMQTTISIRVRSDGEIIEKSFERKSGNSLFDDSAMRAIIKANPLPSVPESFKAEYLDIGVNFKP